MTILENIDIDIDKAVLENIDIDIDKAIFENIDIDIEKDILENIDIDIDMGISENIDIDINIDRDILSEKSMFSAKNRAFSYVFMMKYQYRLSIYRHFLKYRWNINTFFENINIGKILIRKI